MEDSARQFKWSIKSVNSDATLDEAMAVQQEQLDGIKKLFGIFLLGVKFGVGRQEQSGYMGGRRDQCSKSFCSMLGVRAKMILVPCVVFEPGVGEDRRLVKPQYFSRARKWEVGGIGKLVGDSFFAQSNNDLSEGGVPQSEKCRVGYCLVMVGKEFPVRLMNVQYIYVHGLKPQPVTCEDCSDSRATHGLPPDTRRRWWEACSRAHSSAVEMTVKMNKKAPKKKAPKKKARSEGLRDASWAAQLAKVKKYKRRHGDCNVPQRWAEDSKLGS
jgi:hypothetical protein